MDEIAYRLINDLPYYCEHNLKIKPKTGKYKPFVFNKAQDFIHNKLENQKNKTGRVRAILLKGRQQGVSTYVSARYYHQTVTTPGTLTFVFAHDAEASSSLFRMTSDFYEMSDESFRPELGASNQKELLFPKLKSGYKVGTAGTKGLGRSKTFQQVHWSEVAYSPSASDHAAGILQTVSDDNGTEIILESTANGQNDFFHRMCMEALSDDSDWELIFVPWFWQPEYTKEDQITLTQDEQKLIQLYGNDGLTVNHLAWRRKKIKEFEGDDVRFKREYPNNVQEAFEVSDQNSYIKAQDVIESRQSENVYTTAPLIIGVDPAREGGDAIALCHRTGRNITKIKKLPPMDLTQLANNLAQEIAKYKPTRMNIDVGGLGIGVYDMLVGMGYGDTVKSVNFGGKPDNFDKYYNKRAEMYGNAKNWLLDRPNSITNIDRKLADQLQAELSSVGYSWSNNQQLKLESKVDMKKRGLPSPDLADAFVLTFAFPISHSASHTARMYESIQSDIDWSPF